MDRKEKETNLKAMQYRIAELRIEGFKEEADEITEVLDRVRKKMGLPKKDYFAREKKKAKDLAVGVYDWIYKRGDLVSGIEKRKIITKRDVRHYLMYYLDKSDGYASQACSKSKGRWLYQALLYGAIEEIGEDTWAIID